MSRSHRSAPAARGLDLIGRLQLRGKPKLVGGSSPLIEPLEQRRMLSVTLNSGVVQESGTTGNDTVTVDQTAGILTVTENGTPYTFTASSVSQFNANPIGGNDSVVVGSDVTIACSLGGGAGDDTLVGGSGNDTIVGGDGNDSMDGGVGTNTVSYASRVNSLLITLDDEPDSGDPLMIEQDIINNCQNVIGGSGNDSITGNSSPNSILGGGGYDTILGLGGADSLTNNGTGNCSLVGGGGNDLLIGGTTGCLDTLEGGQGNDSLWENGGIGTADYVYETDSTTTAYISPSSGGMFQGSGTIYSSTGTTLEADVLYSGVINIIGPVAGNDTLGGIGDSTPHYYQCGSGNCLIVGGYAADTIIGGSGNDSIMGERGADSITPGSGNSLIYGDTTTDPGWQDASDTILPGSGSDTIYAGTGGKDSITLGGGNSTVNTGNGYGKDTIVGGSGNMTVNAGTDGGGDSILGGSGNDSITANSGNADTINGGGGNDTLHGEANDVFSNIEYFYV